MRNTTIALFASVVLASQALAQATDPSSVEGEIRKIDKEAKKITIRHGDIKNLDMPGMSMVFQAGETVDLDKLKAGQKIRFKAGRGLGGALIANDVEPVSR